jgi:hypothetical protein
MPSRLRFLLTLSLMVIALLASAAVADASSRQLMLFDAPSELLGGAPDAALDEIDALGADAIRVQISWRGVAPAPDARRTPGFNASDPAAYPAGAWSRYDAAIAGARQRGLRVLVTLAGPAPAWATPTRDGLTRPSATAFARFATAAGRRYGRQATWWSIWNEPNLGKLLKPIAHGASALVYRSLYLRAYSGLRAAGVHAPILMGELAPIGNSLRETGTIRPLAFLRRMLCLDNRYRRTARRCAKLPTQGVAMHPYSTKAGPFLMPPADNVTIGVLGRLTNALDRAARAGAIARGRPIFITEFGVQSVPDKRSGVSLALQSDYRSMAELIAWSNPRVRTFSQYLLRDDESTGLEYGKFESGLYMYKGDRAKPALAGFRLPLVVLDRRGSHDLVWGMVRPARRAHRGGTVTIEYRDRGHGWRRLGAQRFGADGTWLRGTRVRPGRGFRMRWTDPDGRRWTSPATYAHRRQKD